jgi:hypothetical protein
MMEAVTSGMEKYERDKAHRRRQNTRCLKEPECCDKCGCQISRRTYRRYGGFCRPCAESED